MMRIDRRHLVSTAVGVILVAVVALLVGRCGKGNNSKEMGPAQVVEQFCRAIASGEFEKAEKLCTVDSMKDYIEAYSAIFSDRCADNSTATGIAAEMLSEMEISISDVAKEGDKRIVFYSMTFKETTKEKIATLVREDGVWKVAAITDRN